MGNLGKENTDINNIMRKIQTMCNFHLGIVIQTEDEASGMTGEEHAFY